MSFSLLQTLHNTPLAFVDVETTGASADYGHRVIELGIARVEQGRIVREYQQLIDPQRRVGPGITALTGISQKMVDGQPTFADQSGAALDLLRGAAIVGHNIRFDLSFLRREFRRANVNLVEELGRPPVFDTVRIARRRFGRGGNGLQRLAPRLGVVPTDAHRALADAVTTAGVFERLLEPVGGWSLSLVDTFQHQGGAMGILPPNANESLLPLELEEALEQKKPVVMEYLDGNTRRTQRVIRPQTVRRFRGELVLVAFCELRQAQRTFKVERIVQLSRIEPEESSPQLALFPIVPSLGDEAQKTDVASNGSLCLTPAALETVIMVSRVEAPSPRPGERETPHRSDSTPACPFPGQDIRLPTESATEDGETLARCRPGEDNLPAGDVESALNEAPLRSTSEDHKEAVPVSENIE